MQDARKLRLLVRGRDTGLESDPFPLERLINHDAEIEFPNGDSLPISDFIYFETDYDLLVAPDDVPDPVSKTIDLNPLSIPKFIRLGSPINGTAMRLVTDHYSSSNKYGYWRDAGLWGIGVEQHEDGKFYSKHDSMDWLDGKELFPITHEEYALDNRGYYSMSKGDYDETEDEFSENDIPF